jgi:hypothetical protein
MEYQDLNWQTTQLKMPGHDKSVASVVSLSTEDADRFGLGIELAKSIGCRPTCIFH